MKRIKMSLENIQGKMSREEMKTIVAGVAEVGYSCWRAANGNFDVYTASGPASAASYQSVWQAFGYQTGCSQISISSSSGGTSV